MDPDRYERLNVYIMGIIYSPLLLYTSYAESKAAKRIKANQFCDQPAESAQEDWNQVKLLDGGDDDWAQDDEAIQLPGEDDEPVVKEVKSVKEEMKELRGLIEQLKKDVTSSWAVDQLVYRRVEVLSRDI